MESKINLKHNEGNKKAEINKTENRKTIDKINEIKSSFFNEISKIDKVLTSDKGEKLKTYKLPMLRIKWGITIYWADIKKIIREHCGAIIHTHT